MRAIEEVAVVSKRPLRKLVDAAAAITVAGACVAVGFVLGAHFGEVGEARRDAVERYVEPTIRRTPVPPAQSVSSTVEAGANERLRRTLKAQRDRIGALEEELGFYQRLVAPAEGQRGFRIERWTVSATETPAEYSYNLLLMQVVGRHESIAGTLLVEVAGERGGVAQALPLAELIVAGEAPQAFQFLYFQDFRGRMTLPQGFVPSRVAVTAQITDSEQPPLERTFDWRVDEE